MADKKVTSYMSKMEGGGGVKATLGKMSKRKTLKMIDIDLFILSLQLSEAEKFFLKISDFIVLCQGNDFPLFCSPFV